MLSNRRIVVVLNDKTRKEKINVCLNGMPITNFHYLSLAIQKKMLEDGNRNFTEDLTKLHTY